MDGNTRTVAVIVAAVLVGIAALIALGILSETSFFHRLSQALS